LLRLCWRKQRLGQGVGRPIRKAGEEGDFSASIYRFGPYYAVEITPEDRSPPATSISGVIKRGRDGALLIYRASDVTLLRVLG
jgi:hypothetical protein